MSRRAGACLPIAHPGARWHRPLVCLLLGGDRTPVASCARTTRYQRALQGGPRPGGGAQHRRNRAAPVAPSWRPMRGPHSPSRAGCCPQERGKPTEPRYVDCLMPAYLDKHTMHSMVTCRGGGRLEAAGGQARARGGEEGGKTREGKGAGRAGRAASQSLKRRVWWGGGAGVRARTRAPQGRRPPAAPRVPQGGGGCHGCGTLLVRAPRGRCRR